MAKKTTKKPEPPPDWLIGIADKMKPGDYATLISSRVLVTKFGVTPCGWQVETWTKPRRTNAKR